MITVPLSPNKKYFQVCGDSYISTGPFYGYKMTLTDLISNKK